MTIALPLTRRQRDILEFLRDYVEEHSISPTLEEIAGHFNVNKVTVFGHIAEMERKGVIRRRARGVSRSLEIVEQEEPAEAGAPALAILGRIAAGSPIETIEEPEQLDFADLVPEGRDVYALEVTGTSMIEDAIADGDIVLIERRSTARNGETVVAVLPDGEATLKRFYKEKGRIRLQPANSSMEPIYAEEVEIRGVVIGVVRKY
ncbi:MAG: transcriptional repressor LexA [Planctomycetota bacterium]